MKTAALFLSCAFLLVFVSCLTFISVAALYEGQEFAVQSESQLAPVPEGYRYELLRQTGKVFNSEYYTIQPGDTLWSISRRAFGQGAGYPALIRWSGWSDDPRVFNPNKIYPGDIVRVEEMEAKEALGLYREKTMYVYRLVLVEPEKPASISFGLGDKMVICCIIFLVLGILFFVTGLVDFFQPVGGGEPVEPEGLYRPSEVLDFIRKTNEESEADVALKVISLQRVRLFGIWNIFYADGKPKQRLASGQLAWLARFSDGTERIILQKCGNDARAGLTTRPGKGGWYQIVGEENLTNLNTVIVPLLKKPVSDAPETNQSTLQLTPDLSLANPEGWACLEPGVKTPLDQPPLDPDSDPVVPSTEWLKWASLKAGTPNSPFFRPLGIFIPKGPAKKTFETITPF